MSKYKPVAGDRVRVVLEGEVGWVSGSGTGNFEVGTGDSYVNPDRAEVVSVDKIEPPVEVFKPGDVVRERTTGVHYALAVDGWTLLNGRDSRHYRKNATGGYVGGEFNSVAYERVPLS